ncbi:MAG: hypothetical protein ACK4NF_03830, partial [Planctomycetota bacterium]
WQSYTITTPYPQKRVIFYTDYLNHHAVNLSLGLHYHEQQEQKILMPVTLFENLPDLTSFYFRIYFDVVDEFAPLFTTPFIRQILVFLPALKGGIATSSREILLKYKKQFNYKEERK